MSDHLPITISVKLENGKFVPENKVDEIKVNNFMQIPKEGDRYHITYEPITDDGSLAQLAKLHKCIRTLASETGEQFEKMKQMVKKRSGLCISFNHQGETHDFYRSFADASKEELSGAIQTSIEMGEWLGVNLL